jgi:hypothetical protein
VVEVYPSFPLHRVVDRRQPRLPEQRIRHALIVENDRGRSPGVPLTRGWPLIHPISATSGPPGDG